MKTTILFSSFAVKPARKINVMGYQVVFHSDAVSKKIQSNFTPNQPFSYKNSKEIRGRIKRESDKCFSLVHWEEDKKYLRFTETQSFEQDLNQRPRDCFGYPLQSPAQPTELSKELVIAA